MQRCVGCQVISEKQDEIKDHPDQHGTKVALIPVAVHAALRLQRELNEAARPQRDRHND